MLGPVWLERASRGVAPVARQYAAARSLLAIGLGIAAGYFRGWVDDIIQYVYTVLNSIPGVLLIAASVLIAKSPCGFRAAYAERAKQIFIARAPGCAPSDARAGSRAGGTPRAHGGSSSTTCRTPAR